MTKQPRNKNDDWGNCTFEAAERRRLMLGLQSTFREKIKWLEEAETLALRFRAGRAKLKKKTR